MPNSPSPAAWTYLAGLLDGSNAIRVDAKGYPFISIQVRAQALVEQLERSFGGRTYKSGRGWSWRLSKRDDQLHVLNGVLDLLVAQRPAAIEAIHLLNVMGAEKPGSTSRERSAEELRRLTRT